MGAGAGSIGTESGSSVMGDGMSSGSFQTTIDALFNGVRQTGESTALTSSSAIGEKASADSTASASAWSENGASAATAGAAGAQSNLGSTSASVGASATIGRSGAAASSSAAAATFRTAFG